MPEASQIEYKLKELTGLMVRDQGIKDGHWMILVRFSHAAANIETGSNDTAPAVISRIESIGIQRVPAPNPISVDASQLVGRQAKAAPEPASGKPKAKAPVGS